MFPTKTRGRRRVLTTSNMPPSLHRVEDSRVQPLGVDSVIQGHKLPGILRVCMCRACFSGIRGAGRGCFCLLECIDCIPRIPGIMSSHFAKVARSLDVGWEPCRQHRLGLSP